MQKREKDFYCVEKDFWMAVQSVLLELSGFLHILTPGVQFHVGITFAPDPGSMISLG
ncbi:MAG: hypothetical protein JXM72_03900 [Deltaproteobacteria bacterium]|nr:hypothetical protein [Deltaproteobacteria bacterium]